MNNTIYFRRDTWDQDIYNSVVTLNEYEIELFSPTDIVIDIGCHIGSFTILAKQKGAMKVFSYEAFIDNYALALKNTAHLENVFVFNKAVTRSDVPINSLSFVECSNALNTGGGDVFGKSADAEVEACSLDNIIREIGSPIRLIKFDCEGSEFPILLSSTLLNSVQEIVGEYHNFDSIHAIPQQLKIEGVLMYNMETLHTHLIAQGFEGSWIHIAENLGKFRYRKKE
jgi:FkbM family methyltransferase